MPQMRQIRLRRRGTCRRWAQMAQDVLQMR